MVKDQHLVSLSPVDLGYECSLATSTSSQDLAREAALLALAAEKFPEACPVFIVVLLMI